MWSHLSSAHHCSFFFLSQIGVIFPVTHNRSPSKKEEIAGVGACQNREISHGSRHGMTVTEKPTDPTDTRLSGALADYSRSCE